MGVSDADLLEEAIHEAWTEFVNSVSPYRDTNTESDNEWEALTQGFKAGVKFAKEVINDVLES